MKNTLTKLEFHYSFMIIALSYILTGYFKYLIISTSIILIHELGHLFMMNKTKCQITKITIYPFGGIIKASNLINISLSKELKISIFGFVFQFIYFILIIILTKINLVSDNTFNIFITFNTTIFLFNILPIIPLDGSKILNIFLNKFLSFKKANLFSVYLSLISLIILLIFYKNFNYSYVILLILLLKNIYNYYQNIEYYFHKFLLERYIYNFNFKKIKIINKKDNMMRDYYHFIKNKGFFQKEKAYLHDLFDNKRHL